jgi:hypothetical protein
MCAPAPPKVDGGLLSEFPSLMGTDSVSRFGKKEDELDVLGEWIDMPAALQGLPKYRAGKTNLTKLVRRGGYWGVGVWGCRPRAGSASERLGLP